MKFQKRIIYLILTSIYLLAIITILFTLITSISERIFIGEISSSVIFVETNWVELMTSIVFPLLAFATITVFIFSSFKHEDNGFDNQKNTYWLLGCAIILIGNSIYDYITNQSSMGIKSINNLRENRPGAFTQIETLFNGSLITEFQIISIILSSLLVFLTGFFAIRIWWISKHEPSVYNLNNEKEPHSEESIRDN